MVLLFSYGIITVINALSVGHAGAARHAAQADCAAPASHPSAHSHDMHARAPSAQPQGQQEAGLILHLRQGEGLL